MDFATMGIIFIIFGEWALLILRVAFGAMMVAHGWQKIKNLRANAESFNGMGFRPGAFWGTLATIVEFFGGIALILGLGTRPVAAVFAVLFVVITIWMIARKTPFTKGVDFHLLAIAAALVLLTLGGGLYALNNLLFLGW